MTADDRADHLLNAALSVLEGLAMGGDTVAAVALGLLRGRDCGAGHRDDAEALAPRMEFLRATGPQPHVGLTAPPH
jgi:hypothetical protein